MKSDSMRQFDDEIHEQQDYPAFKQHTPIGTSSAFSKDFSKLQHKLLENKRKRNLNTATVKRDIAVPQSRDTLLLKYGPAPNNKSSILQRRHDQEIPSYKLDAMRLIINRIYKQVGFVFEELQRKVMVEDVMQAKRIKHQNQAIIESLRQLKIGGHGSDLGKDYGEQQSAFRQRFEEKKQRIKQSLQKGSVEESMRVENQMELQVQEQQEEEAQRIHSQFATEYNLQQEQKKPQLYQNKHTGRLDQNKESKLENQEPKLPLDLLSNDQDQSQDLPEPKITSPFHNSRPLSSRTENQRYLSSDGGGGSDNEREELIDIVEQQDPQPTNLDFTSSSLAQDDKQDEIIKPSKKVTSYLNSDIKERLNNTSKTLQARSSKQQEIVEMSFSENPFGNRKLSSQLNFNQHSPDFNKGKQEQIVSSSNKPQTFISPQFQSNAVCSSTIMEQDQEQSMIGKNKSVVMELEEIKQVDSAVEGNTKKAKFAQSLKMLMSELELKKENIQDQTNTQSTNTSVNNKYKQLLSTITNKAEETQSGTSKIQTLKKNRQQQQQQVHSTNNQLNTQQFPQNVTDQSQNPIVIESTKAQNIQPIETPLGLMHKISSNTVLFIEKRDTVAKQVSQQVRVKQNRRKQQQSQFNQCRNQSELDMLEQTMKASKKKQVVELLAERLLKKLRNWQKMVLLELFRFSIDKSKGEMIKRIQNNSKWMLSKAFRQWKQYNQQQFQQELNKRRDQQYQALNSLVLLIKLKQVSQTKQAFDQINSYFKAVLKQAVDQKQKHSIQIIANYLIRKDKVRLNKKFQKYRKAVFLLNFDQKLLSLTQLLNDKVDLNKKDGFKSILNHCLRNDQFKRQYQQLSEDYVTQQEKIRYKALTRAVKIAKAYLYKSGYQVLKSHFQDKIKMQKVLTRMHQTLSKYNTSQEAKLSSKYLSRWRRVVDSMNKQQEQRVLSCKKVKLLLTVARSRHLKARFEIWKSETTNFLNIELTKHNQEREQFKVTRLEQVMVDLWWQTLQSGFQPIKQRSVIKKQMSYLLKKKEGKILKQSKSELFARWRRVVSRQKFLKIHLQVIVKNLENRLQKSVNVYLQRWKQVRWMKLKQEGKIERLVQQKLRKISEGEERVIGERFQIWKTKVQKMNYFKQVVIEFSRQRELKELLERFKLWRQLMKEDQLKEEKQVLIQNQFSKVLMKFKFKKLKENTEHIQKKNNAAKLLNKILKVKQEQSLRSSLGILLTESQKKQVAECKKKESVKLIRRLKAVINKRELQRCLMQWKLNSTDKAQKQETLKVIKQYQRRALLALVNKSKQQQLIFGFQSFKLNVSQYQKQTQQYLMQKQQSGHQISSILQTLYSKTLKSTLKALVHQSKEVEQDKRVTMAISKLSAATKIIQLMNHNRSDRMAFQAWRAATVTSQNCHIAVAMLSNLLHSHLKSHFSTLKKQSHQLMIDNTKKIIGKNMMKVLLYKMYKEQTIRAFNLWASVIHKPSTKKQRKMSSLPPRSGSIISESHNATQIKIFNNSKVNSANNSIIQNQRYSSKGDDDDDYMQDDEINGQGQQLFVISSHKNQNNKSVDIFVDEGDNDMSPGEELLEKRGGLDKRASTTKNQKISHASLWSFLEHEKECSPSKLSNIESEESSHLIMPQVSIKEEEFKIAATKTEKVTKKSNTSRNKTQSLNKYLSNNSSNSSKAQAVSIDLSTAQNTQQQENLTRNSNVLKQAYNSVMSPKSSLSLEPVPEEPLPKKKSTKRKKEGTSVSSKLSNFLSQPPSTTSRRPVSKEEQKHRKKKSLENQERFKMFLQKGKKEDKKPNLKPGFEKLERIFRHYTLRRTLEDLITEVFDEGWDPIYQENLRKRQRGQLEKVVKIKSKIMKDGRVVKWEAFSLWKRSDYLTMLSSLQRFKDSLTQIYSKQQK